MNDAADHASREAEDEATKFDGKVSEIFNFTMSRSFGMDGLSTHEDRPVSSGQKLIIIYYC